MMEAKAGVLSSSCRWWCLLILPNPWQFRSCSMSPAPEEYCSMSKVSRLQDVMYKAYLHLCVMYKGDLHPLYRLSSPSPVSKTGLKSPRLPGWNVKLLV